jgi:hypothetical protein
MNPSDPPPNHWRVVTTGLLDKRTGRVVDIKTEVTPVYVPEPIGEKLTHGEFTPT